MEMTPKDKLLQAATHLFTEHGFHAVGINRILAEAGVAKKTLYRYFASKEELIVAVLKAYDEQARTLFRTQVDARASDPEGKILAFFDVAHEWFQDHRFFGCLFVGAVGEYSNGQSDIRSVCQGYKNSVRAFLQDLCFQAGLADPLDLGDRLFMLFEGATVMAQVSGDARSALIAKSTAQALMKANRLDD